MTTHANDDERNASMSRMPAVYTPDLPGLLPGRYELPRAADYAGSNDARDRLTAYLAGRADIATLEPEEVDFLREDITRQVTQNRARALGFFNHRVPHRYRDVDPADPRAADWAAQFVHDPRNTPSLLIVGATGTGKTHLAYAILRAVAETGTPAAFGWRATTAADLYADLRPRTGADSETRFRSYADSPLLFVDDIGGAKVTDWTEEITYRLINQRYEQCRPVLLTSNLSPAELREHLGERIASRLAEMTVKTPVMGEDRRRKPTQ